MRRGRRNGRARRWRIVRRRSLETSFDAEVVVADLDQVAFLDGGRLRDAVAVDEHAVVGPDVLDEQLPVLALEACVAPRDISFRQLHDVSVVAPDGNLVADERDDGLAPLVVLDDELHAALRRQAPSA